MKRSVFFALIALGALLYCSNNQIAGGSGTETTNSFAFLESGAPAGNCKVLLIDPDTWLSQAGSGAFLIDSTISRNDGSFSFEYEVPGEGRNLSIQIDHDSSGLFRPAVSFGDIDGTTFILTKYSSVRGSIQNVHEFIPVKIGGTAYGAITDATGSFIINRIPSGKYAFFTQGESGYVALGSVQLPSDSMVTVTLPKKSAQTFLVTDFECGYRSPVSEACGIELFWYTFSDSSDKGYDYELSRWVDNTSSEVIKTGKSTINCTIGSDTNGSHSLQVDGVLDQSSSFPYAGAGMVLYTQGDNGVNLQSADSLRFDVKGRGQLRIIFITEHPVTKADARFSAVVPLNKTVSSISVGLKSLKMDTETPDSMRVSWEQACGKVRIIEFAFYGSDNSADNVFSAEIDNVAFVGSGLQSTLVKQGIQE